MIHYKKVRKANQAVSLIYHRQGRGYLTTIHLLWWFTSQILPFKFSFCGLNGHTHILTEISFERDTVNIFAAFAFSYWCNVKNDKENTVCDNNKNDANNADDEFTPPILAAEGDVWQDGERYS